jgi:hypothetical protein
VIKYESLASSPGQNIAASNLTEDTRACLYNSREVIRRLNSGLVDINEYCFLGSGASATSPAQIARVLHGKMCFLHTFYTSPTACVPTQSILPVRLNFSHETRSNELFGQCRRSWDSSSNPARDHAEELFQTI